MGTHQTASHSCQHIVYGRQLLTRVVCLQVAVGLVLLGALIGWFMPFGLGGRHWSVYMQTPHLHMHVTGYGLMRCLSMPVHA